MSTNRSGDYQRQPRSFLPGWRQVEPDFRHKAPRRRARGHYDPVPPGDSFWHGWAGSPLNLGGIRGAHWVTDGGFIASRLICNEIYVDFPAGVEVNMRARGDAGVAERD